MLETKPYWTDVPKKLQQEMEGKLGSHIIKGERIFGGFGPSATFRLF